MVIQVHFWSLLEQIKRPSYDPPGRLLERCGAIGFEPATPPHFGDICVTYSYRGFTLFTSRCSSLASVFQR